MHQAACVILVASIKLSPVVASKAIFFTAKKMSQNRTDFDGIWAAPFFETVRNFDTHRSLLIALLCARADAP
jgi:hypothetical protein